jgi:hypothetical protein
MGFEQEEEIFKNAIGQIIAVIYWMRDEQTLNPQELMDDETYNTLFPQAFELWKEWKNHGL